jgi:uncharacterized protein YbjT (DUF2867 family)
MILVTGAAGKTGRAVIQSLIAEGQRVRGLVRRQEQVVSLERLGVVDAVVGDISSREILEEAGEGVKAIYHICPNMHPDEASIGETVIRAAQSAGIERFVYHSVLHPQIEAMAHHWQKMRVEEMLFESGLSYTILQPAAYMQNVLANWERIVGQGVYAVPYALETRLSMVDLKDVAEAAAKVLTEAGHAGATYELCGAEVLSQRDIAIILGEQLGQLVRGERIPIEIWEQQARSARLGDYAVQTLVRMFRYYERNDFWGNGQVMGWLLGRSPTTFADFLEQTI